MIQVYSIPIYLSLSQRENYPLLVCLINLITHRRSYLWWRKHLSIPESFNGFLRCTISLYARKSKGFIILYCGSTWYCAKVGRLKAFSSAFELWTHTIHISYTSYLIYFFFILLLKGLEEKQASSKMPIIIVSLRWRLTCPPSFMGEGSSSYLSSGHIST